MAHNQEPTTASTKNVYVTLITRPSYLAGAILLAHSLSKHSPSTPLIIVYTPETLPEKCVQALRVEAKYSNVVLSEVEHLRLLEDEKGDGMKESENKKAGGMVAERFIDTWTKLRVFELYATDTEQQEFDYICFLDADMLVLSNPSPLIFNSENEEYVNGQDGLRLMAVHTCVCNLDHDTWAPSSWTPENCAFTHLSSPEQIPAVSSTPPTFNLFNSGAFLFRPSRHLSEYIKKTWHDIGPSRLKAMQFPDQDFLNEVFCDRWKSLSWRVNALKTWRYWHTNIWRDDQVSVLHYIVDKPWVARLKPDGTAGYLGKDGTTHSWWWDEFSNWRSEREGQGEKALLETIGKYVASESGDENEEMRAIGQRVQDYAKKWEGEKQGGGDNKDDEDTFGPVLRKKMLGEKGHGPVVKGSDL